MVDFGWVFWPHHQFLLECLSKGGEARFVGGAIRNTLRGIAPDDFDIAATHLPGETISLLQAQGIPVVPTGLAHGTVTAILHGEAYEITTLRKDVQTDGRRAQVEYTSLWEEDAQRRDFTMNALYIDKTGQIYDYVNGQEDALLGRLRFIGDPYQRIHEDYLRILRLFRLWAYYGQYVDPLSFKAACELKSYLSRLSGERITKELLKLLKADKPWTVVNSLFKEGFFPFILGELEKMPLFPYLKTLERALNLSSDPLLRLASLLAGSVPKNSPLVLSRHQLHWLKIINIPLNFEHALEGVYETSIDLAKARLIFFACSLMSKRPVQESPKKYLRLIIERLKETLSWLEGQVFPPFPIDGRDLLTCGFSGPELGEALKWLKSWWIAHQAIPTREECLQQLKNYQKIDQKSNRFE